MGDGDAGLDVELGPLSWPAALRTTAAFLAGSAPVVLVCHLAAVAVSALVGPLTAAAVGLVVSDLAAHSGHVVGTGEVWAPTIVLGASLLIGGLVGSGVDSWGKFVIGERFTGLFERAVMRGVGSIPGLAPFEDPALADVIEVTRWTAGGEFSGGGGVARLYADSVTALGYLIGAAGAAVVLSRWSWWAPLIICGAEVPAAVIAWRHSGLLVAGESAAAEPYRRAHLYLRLGFEPPAGKEVRVFDLGDWLGERHHNWWTTAFATILDDLGRHIRAEAVMAVGRLVAVGPLVLAVLGTHRPGPGPLTAGLLSLPILMVNIRALLEWPAQAHRNLAHMPQASALASLRPAPTRGRLAPTGSAEVRFEGVSFSYPGTERRVLADLDLCISAGSSLALVGVNGCGKTSLIKLLCRFYDPDEGRILLDGVDLRDYDLNALRASMAATLQDFVRYPFDLATNVTLGCVDRPDLLPEALRLAGAADLAERTPGEVVLDRTYGGVDLSGGEWQRIALARTMMARLGRNPAIVIADEPTAHLDVTVEAELYRRFSELTAGRTTILTSHRMSTVRMAERIAVMEAGRIVEDGSHDELLDAGGRYAAMFELQARRFRETGGLE